MAGAPTFSSETPSQTLPAGDALRRRGPTAALTPHAGLTRDGPALPTPCLFPASRQRPCRQCAFYLGEDHHVILEELQQLLFFPHLCFLPILLQFC